MRNFAVVFLVAVVVTGAVANANNRVTARKLDDPLTPPTPTQMDRQMKLDGQMELDDPLTPPKPTDDDADCIDNIRYSRYCKSWAFRSYCTRGRYTTFMANYCPKSCNKCDCQDQYSSCDYWANTKNYCKSSRYINFMTMFCKKSCDECGGSCIDKYSRCPYWAHIRGYCTNFLFRGFMARHCKNSCKHSC